MNDGLAERSDSETFGDELRAFMWTPVYARYERLR
jgi:hypothetical protein